MALPVVTAVVVPFPAGVAAVTLTGALFGILFDGSQNVPNAVLTIQVAGNQGAAAGFGPLMEDGATTGTYPGPLQIPIGRGGYFPIPIEMQNIPAKAQLTVQNAGINVSVQLVTSA